jgi:flagellar assembly protein FliH
LPAAGRKKYLFKSVYRTGEYQMQGTPYKLRGVVLPRRTELEQDISRKKKEESHEEKLERLKLEIDEAEKILSGKQSEIKLLQDEYVELMLKTDEDAKNMIAEAEKQAVEIKEAAQKQGYEDGNAAGYTDGTEKAGVEAEQKYSEFLNTMKNLAESAAGEKHKIISGTEDDIVDLSIDIARKVVNQELSASRDIVINFVQEAIKLLEDKEKIIIYANPQDINLIKAHRDEFRELVDTADSLHILPDEFLERGECRLESKSEIIDTDINYQFWEIKKKLHSGD